MKDTDLEWKELDELNPEARQKNLFLIEQFIQEHPEAVMDHDPEWLYTKCGKDKSVKIFVCFASDGALIGYAPFFVHPSALSFELFGLSLFDYRIRRYCITAGPLLTADYLESDVLLENLLVKMLDSLGNRDVLFGLGVALDSYFGRLLRENNKLRKSYQVFPHGTLYKRRSITLPNDIDAYIKKLGKNTRQELRRVQRQLENDIAAAASYRVFTDPGEVPELLKLLEKVSIKTYQHKLLNLGISNNAETCRTLTLAAEKGWLRSYILSCKEEPVSYKHGYLYKDVFYSERVGYDPKWSSASVGTVMHIYVVQDLIHIGAKKFDFMYGDSGNKERLSNSYHEEQNFYLVPRTFPLSAVAYALRAFNSLADLIGKFVEKYGIKTRIRRILRRHATTNK